jgi:phage-related protein
MHATAELEDKSEKTPQREIKIARSRMKEIRDD